MSEKEPDWLDYFYDFLESEFKKRKNVPPAKYDVNDSVSFTMNDETKTGYIAIVDKYGTFEQSEEPSYDVYVDAENVLYKHIRQSSLTKL